MTVDQPPEYLVGLVYELSILPVETKRVRYNKNHSMFWSGAFHLSALICLIVERGCRQVWKRKVWSFRL